jgi:hypothetical protein
MDVRRSINTKIWCDEWFENLAPEEKLIWLYLLTNQQTNMLGVYEISIRKISFETGLSEDQIRAAFLIFEDARKAFYTDGFVILTNWLRNQSLNTNMRVAAVQLYDRLPNDLKYKLNANPLKGFESLYQAFETLRKKEKEKEIEKEKESEIENPSDELSVKILLDGFKDTFHELCPSLPRITKLTDQRRSHLRARISEHGEETVRNVFRIAGQSKFLSGDNQNRWQASFDWIIAPTNFMKILEGNYNNKEHNEGNGQFVEDLYGFEAQDMR